MIAFMIYGGLALTALGGIFMYIEIKTDREMARQEEMMLTFPSPVTKREKLKKVA